MRIAFAGNPNSGKTTMYNALTGRNEKVGNWAGVTVDNKEIFVPNSQLSAAKVVNYTALGKRRVDLNFTASYDAPTAEVKAAIREVVDAIPEVMTDRPCEIWLTEYQAANPEYDYE